MLSARTLLSTLLLAAPAAAQFDCSTAVVLDPCGGDSYLPPAIPIGTPSTPCGTFPAVWAPMTPSRSGPVTLALINMGTRSIAVYTGSCGSLTQLLCETGPVTFLATEGATYYFQYENFVVGVPEIYASVVDPNCAPNDSSECQQAISLDSCGGETVFYALDNSDYPSQDSACTRL